MNPKLKLEQKVKLVLIKTKTPEIFHKFQKFLHENKIKLHTFNHPKDRNRKVVIRSISTDISETLVSEDLEHLEFNVKTVKCFGAPFKPMPMCLEIIAKDTVITNIYMKQT